MMKYHQIAILLFLLLQACSGVKINDEYYNNAKRYFNVEFGIDVSSSESTYIIVPLQGCKSCLGDCLSYIETIDMKDNYTIVLVGVESAFFEDDIKRCLSKIKREFNCLFDNRQHIYKYRTGFSHPLKMYFGNGTSIYLELRYLRGKPRWLEVL